MMLRHREFLPLSRVSPELNNVLRAAYSELRTLMALASSPPDHVVRVGHPEYRTLGELLARGPIGGRVYVHAGSHLLRDQNVNLADGAFFQGGGFDTVLNFLKGSSATRPTVKALNVAGVRLHDLTILGNSDLSGNYGEHDHGVHWERVNRGVLEGCYIREIAGDAVYICDSERIVIRGLWIRVPTRSTSPLVGRNGIAIVKGKQIIIEGCIIQGGYPAVVDIEPNQSQDVYEVVIRGNLITHLDDDGSDLAPSGMGISINQTNGNIRRVIIDGNLIVGTQQDGIAVLGYANESSADLAGEVIIANNLLYNVNRTSSGREGAISLANQFRRILVAGNVIHRTGKNGIFLYQHDLGAGKYGSAFVIANNIVSEAEEHGIYAYSASGDSPARDFIVSGNVSVNNGQAVGYRAGIKLMFARKAVVSSNLCADLQGTATQKYGIHLYACDGVLLTPDNVCHGNQGPQILVDGGADARDGSLREYEYIATTIVDDGANRALLPQEDFSGANDWVVAMGGYVVGIEANIAGVSGYLNVYATINGALKSGLGVQLSDTVRSAATRQFNRVGDAGYSVNAGDRVGAVYNAPPGGTYTAPLLAKVLVAHVL